MSRVQLALNVDDVEVAAGFYAALFGVEPAKRRPGYANFVVDEPPLKLVLLENAGQGGGLNHLGVEVGSTEEVSAQLARLTVGGVLAEPEQEVTCCYATQDKFWVTAPDGERWEHYAVLADTPTFSGSGSGDAEADGDCCVIEPSGECVATCC